MYSDVMMVDILYTEDCFMMMMLYVYVSMSGRFCMVRCYELYLARVYV